MGKYLRTTLCKATQMNNYLVFKCLFLAVLLFLSGHSLGAIDVYDFDDDAKRADFVSLTKELRCPKCQNQDIADSNAPIAKDMRTEVHRMLNEGKDKDSIISHMIERFGEFVTYKPKKTTETYMLWYGPWVLIALGIIIILSLSRFSKKEADKSPYTSEEVKDLLAKYEDKK